MLKDEKELDFNESVKDTRKEMDFDANKKPIEPKQTVNKTIKYGFDTKDKEDLFRDKAKTLGGFNVGNNIPDGRGFGGSQFNVSAPHNHKHWDELDKYAKQINTAYTDADLKRLKELHKQKYSEKFDKYIDEANNTYFPEHRGKDAAQGFITDYEYGNFDENYNPRNNYKLSDEEKEYITNRFTELRPEQPQVDEITDEELKEELVDNQYWYGSAKSVDEVAQRLVDRTKISPEKAKEFSSKYWKGDETWSDEEINNNQDLYDEYDLNDEIIDNKVREILDEEQMKNPKLVQDVIRNEFGVHSSFDAKDIADRWMKNNRYSKEEKPLHVRSFERQVANNPQYKSMADSITDDKELNDAYFYAFKDAFEKTDYNPSARDVANELSDRYWSLADGFKEQFGMSDGEFDRYGITRFEYYYGTESEFIDKGIEAFNNYLDNLG